MAPNREQGGKISRCAQQSPVAASNGVLKRPVLPASAAASTDKSKLTLVASEVTGTLWCSYHQGYAHADSGAFLLRNSRVASSRANFSGGDADARGHRSTSL
jgi:hypothetical protein